MVAGLAICGFSLCSAALLWYQAQSPVGLHKVGFRAGQWWHQPFSWTSQGLIKLHGTDNLETTDGCNCYLPTSMLWPFMHILWRWEQYNFQVPLMINSNLIAGLPAVREKSLKNFIFQGQGKVGEFCKKSGKIFGYGKVWEKSGNFVMNARDTFFITVLHLYVPYFSALYGPRWKNPCISFFYTIWYFPTKEFPGKKMCVLDTVYMSKIFQGPMTLAPGKF